MRMVDLILKKRFGREHSDDEIRYIVDGCVRGDIKDYQLSAWMMAVCLNGMTMDETAALTMAMAHSGVVADLSSISGVKVDKHSTGGVGDTTTLVVAPLVAACGGVVAKMSGRGLGHTGGTLDKLEAIPGVSVERSTREMCDMVKKIGLCITGQTEGLVPADRIMYALRDVTGTVESVPLIASSIMSKKIAAGADAIVLDVKAGNGAFMKTVKDARELANAMVDIGTHLGRRTVAVITDMNQPLGRAVGNGLEVKEAVEVLTGRIGLSDPLTRVCMLLASKMLILGSVAPTSDKAESMLVKALEDGAAFSKLKDMVALLGGDTSYLDEPDMLCKTRMKLELKSDKSGFVNQIDAHMVGVASSLLGAGRETKEDLIDPSVGLVLNRRLGERIDKGDSLLTMYVNDESLLDDAVQLLRDSFKIGPEAHKSPPMVYGMIDENGYISKELD